MPLCMYLYSYVALFCLVHVYITVHSYYSYGRLTNSTDKYVIIRIPAYKKARKHINYMYRHFIPVNSYYNHIYDREKRA